MRIKDKHSSYLNTSACQVNMVWNFCNEHSIKVLQREHCLCSAFDLHPYMTGAGKEGLDLHSQTIQAIAEEYVTRRKQFKKARLNWRVSRGSRKSLGWIPFKASAITYKAGQLHLASPPNCCATSSRMAMPCKRGPWHEGNSPIRRGGCHGDKQQRYRNQCRIRSRHQLPVQTTLVPCRKTWEPG